MMNMCVYQSDFKIIEERQNKRKSLDKGQYRFLNKNKVEKCYNKNAKQTTFVKKLQRERMIAEYYCIYPLTWLYSKNRLHFPFFQMKQDKPTSF